MGYWPKKTERKIYLCPSCNVFDGYDVDKTHCGKCGATLIRECPQCKKDIEKGFTHCQYCGQEYRLPKA